MLRHIYILVSASIIADITAIAQVKNTVIFFCVPSLGKCRELRRLTIGKLLELELSLSYYLLSLPSKEE